MIELHLASFWFEMCNVLCAIINIRMTICSNPRLWTPQSKSFKQHVQHYTLLQETFQPGCTLEEWLLSERWWDDRKNLRFLEPLEIYYESQAKKKWVQHTIQRTRIQTNTDISMPIQRTISCPSWSWNAQLAPGRWPHWWQLQDLSGKLQNQPRAWKAQANNIIAINPARVYVWTGELQFF